ncbi:unnamed protein product [Choristocarpus tenellus]
MLGCRIGERPWREMELSRGAEPSTMGGEGRRGGSSWMVELVAQRDAALIFSRKLAQQLDSQATTLERRAKTAEQLREEAERVLFGCSMQIPNKRVQAPDINLRIAVLIGSSLLAWGLCAVVAVAGWPMAGLTMVRALLSVSRSCHDHTQSFYVEPSGLHFFFKQILSMLCTSKLMFLHTDLLISHTFLWWCRPPTLALENRTFFFVALFA